jgi:hypothetical protein
MLFRAFAATACLLAASFGAFAADTMRCEGAIVREGMIAGEVLAKCGEPSSKRVEEVPIRARNRNGGVNVVGSAKIETWVYDRGAGQFPAALTFDEGKLKSIEYLTTAR